MIAKIFVLATLISSAFSQMIVNPANGTYWESGSNVMTIIDGLKSGQKYRLAFYPTDTGNILWNMNFTAHGQGSEFYPVHIPLNFTGNGTIQLLDYKTNSVPTFSSINVFSNQGSVGANSKKSMKNL